MSKIIWTCSKQKLEDNTETKIKAICEFLLPDNIEPNPPIIKVNSCVAYGIINPKNTIEYHQNSVALGLIFGKSDSWHIPGQEYPDGSFAIFRDDENKCELLSDYAGSRTIWYFFDDSNLVASTSQIALIRYIENFEFNKNTIPWILTTGTLGPDYSWDKRVKKLPPDSYLSLDKEKWKIEINTIPIIYESIDGNKKFHKDNLQNAINKTFKEIRIDLKKWVLPLSGGFDSRSILFYLKSNNFSPISTITWGISSAINDKESDAYVANELSEKLETDHHYFETEFSKEPLEKIINRFIKNGEGRIDHITGYLDGFEIWKELHNKNVQGILRGDENFGWHKVYNEEGIPKSVGIIIDEEFYEIKEVMQELGIEQHLPNYLNKLESESNAQWRDRLYHQFRLQSMIAALSDLKLSYIEQISPLLSRRIGQTVRKTPDKYRTDKRIFRTIINDFNPKVKYATKASVASSDSILKSSEFYQFLKTNLNSYIGSGIVTDSLIKKIINNLSQSNKELTNTDKINLKTILKKLIPPLLYNHLKNKLHFQKKIDYNKIAFRIIIIYKMNQILNND